ncbi:MAG TPA: plastocyanin/azurin family copper-binding protein [Bryobacteraceae bacterium]|jgi:plastocyanin
MTFRTLIAASILLSSLFAAEEPSRTRQPVQKPGEHLVIQKDRAFSVTELTIKPGESVVFWNADEVPHNVFSNSNGMQFDIRRQAPGESSTVPFPKEGVAEVRCAIHPKMKLIVTVKK